MAGKVSRRGLYECHESHEEHPAVLPRLDVQPLPPPQALPTPLPGPDPLQLSPPMQLPGTCAHSQPALCSATSNVPLCVVGSAVLAPGLSSVTYSHVPAVGPKPQHIHLGPEKKVPGFHRLKTPHAPSPAWHPSLLSPQPVPTTQHAGSIAVTHSKHEAAAPTRPLAGVHPLGRGRLHRAPA